jgi:uncharacterized protein (UPF0335 family)
VDKLDRTGGTAMTQQEITKALRWLANETEFIFAADTLRKAANKIERLQVENATLKAERDAAVRCISDIETYLELGTGKFAYKAIQAWRGVKTKESAGNGK